jgi:hypothetical protein
MPHIEKLWSVLTDTLRATFMMLGAARLLLLVVLLTFCWTFFPPTQHTFDRLKVVSINITNSIEYNEAMSQILYILDSIESEATTRFKNRSSDRMMTSD